MSERAKQAERQCQLYSSVSANAGEYERIIKVIEQAIADETAALRQEIAALKAREDALIEMALEKAAQVTMRKVVHGDQYGTWTAECEYAKEHADVIRAITPAAIRAALAEEEKKK